MKKHPILILVIVLAVGGVTFLLYSIVKTIATGVKNVENIPSNLLADAEAAWNSAKNYVAGIFNYTPAPSTPETAAAVGNSQSTFLGATSADSIGGILQTSQPDNSGYAANLFNESF